MPLLAIWFPPVGFFSVVLAVVGAIVAILALKGWKRIVAVALFVSLGIGEIVAIFKADAVHQVEAQQMQTWQKNVTAKLNDIIDTPPSKERQQAVVKLKREVENPPIIAIAPKGIANAAPNFGNQTVNNVPPSRVLSNQQLTNFTAALGKVKGTLRVVQASSSDDVFELSQQLCAAAQSAKWSNACSKSRNSGMGTEAVAKGFECYSENWGTDDAIAFQDAMKAAQLTCIYFPRAYNTGSPLQNFGTRGVTILIGSPLQN